MKTIKMLRNAYGSPDGFSVLPYEEGKVYSVSDDLADVFVRDEMAELTDEPVKEKAVEGAEENTADVPAENKAKKAK